MADSSVRVFPDSTGKFIDTESITSGPNTVQRQRIQIAGTALSDIVSVKNNQLQVGLNQPGTEADAATDSGSGGDGLIDLTTGPDLLLAVSVGLGTFYNLTSWTWLSDKLCLFRLEIDDSGTLVKTFRVMSNSPGCPGGTMYFPTPIKITGAANREIRVKVTRINGTGGAAHSAINGFTS
jgi:hypothetical protein